MKKTSVALTAFLGLALAANPLAAFAQDDTVSTNASARVEVDGGGLPNAKGILHDLKARLDERKKGDIDQKFRMGSDTPAWHGSTTRPERGEDNGKHMGTDLASLIARGTSEIGKRIDSLQAQITRIGKMERLSADQKASITAELNAQITSLTALKAKISADTDIAVVKEDMKSITKEFRVYMVTMPKAAIIAASDRIMHVVGQMETFATKLADRVGTTGSAEATAALADFNAKIADAKVQAQAGASLVANLAPDNGDTIVAEANKTALKNAKAKIDAGQADLKAARKDMETIMKAVRGNSEAHASAGASTGA